MKRSELKRKATTKRRTKSPRCDVRGCTRVRVPSLVLCRTHTVAECDRLARDRKRAEVTSCARCGSTFNLQWSHHLSRRFMVVRWNPENATMHCAACHTWLTHNPAAHVEWARSYVGDEVWAELYAMVYPYSQHFGTADLIEWFEELREAA